MSNKAYEIANRILGMELALFKCSNRHTGIIGAHAELWCEKYLAIELSSTGISPGSDGSATESSPLPLKAGDSIQIKGRSRETMHVTFNPDPVDWLCVIEYNWDMEPVGIMAYLFEVNELRKLADEFFEEIHSPAIPLKYKGMSLRIEWYVMKGVVDKAGKVRGQKDTWERRIERAEKVRKIMYTWDLSRSQFIKHV